MNAALDLLERMAVLSGEMVALAVANDWDALVERESEMAGLRRTLAALEPMGQQQAGQDAEALVRKAVLARQIADDAENIRTHVLPWMDSARKFISAGVKDRAVRSAYGAGSP